MTGSEGFVGHHLRAAIEARGAECVGVDLPGSGAELEVDLSAPDFDPAGLAKLAGDVDLVIYMAAKITRGSSVDADARNNLRAIAEAPARLIEALPKNDVHLVLCSTFKMYGPPDHDGPIDPSNPPQSPDPHSYGSAKFLAERLMEISSARHGHRFAVVRPSCIYGPGQHAHNAIPRFLRALIDGDPPMLFGEGSSVRDDVLAADLSWLMVEAGLQKAEGAYHAAGECSRSVREVAELCCEVAAEEGLETRTPTFDTSRAPKWWIDQDFDLGSSKTLGYAPTPLREGLRAQLRWTRAGSDPSKTASFVSPTRDL